MAAHPYPFQALASALSDQNTGQVRKIILMTKSNMYNIIQSKFRTKTAGEILKINEK